MPPRKAATRRVVESPEVAPPVGPFSHATLAGNLVFLSGQIALDPKTGALVGGDAAAQREQALRNVLAVLEAAGRSLSDVIKASVFLTDMRDFPAMNAVFGRHFEPPYPARTTVAVAALPLGAAVEIDVVAR
jgi:2-iminobutanoate/2-iminopropanoate deaminase